MGAGLVGRAIAYGVDVSLQPNEYRLLIGMCLTALDSDERPRYFDSREAMALFLGRRVTDHGPDRAAAFQAVKVALQGLVKVGALERVRKGGNGRRAEYILRLDVDASLSTAEGRRRAAGVGRAYPSGVRPPYQLGYAEPTDEVGRAYPSGIEEPQEPQEELSRLNETTSLGPVDNQRGRAA